MLQTNLTPTNLLVQTNSHTIIPTLFKIKAKKKTE